MPNAMREESEYMNQEVLVIKNNAAVIDAAKSFQKFLNSKFKKFNDVEDYLADLTTLLLQKPKECQKFYELVMSEDDKAYQSLKNRTIWRLKDIHKIKTPKKDSNLYSFHKTVVLIGTRLKKPNGEPLINDIEPRSFVRKVERRFSATLDDFTSKPQTQKHRKIHHDHLLLLEAFIYTSFCISDL